LHHAVEWSNNFAGEIVKLGLDVISLVGGQVRELVEFHIVEAVSLSVVLLDDFVVLCEIFEKRREFICSAGKLFAVLSQVFQVGLLNLGAEPALKRKQVNGRDTLASAEDGSEAAHSSDCADDHEFAEAGPVSSSLLLLLRFHYKLLLL
jgi:hypothetical protein